MLIPAKSNTAILGGRKMKRTMILIAVVLLLAMVLPMSAMAQAYSLAGTDVSLTVDDSVWYVFIRDNLVDNPELA